MKIEQREWLWSLLFIVIFSVIFLAAAINIVLAVWGLFDDGGHRDRRDPLAALVLPAATQSLISPLPAGPEPAPGVWPTMTVTPPATIFPHVESGVEAQSPRIATQTASEPSSPAPVRDAGWVLTPTDRAILYASTPGAVEWIPQLEALAHCESSFSPGAIGDNGASRGLFQIQRLWFDLAGEDWGAAFDPAVNLRVALLIVKYQIEREQPPFSAWTCARGW